MAEEVKKEQVKKKGPLDKLKEFSHDKEEQMEIFSTFVSLGILFLCYYRCNSRFFRFIIIKKWMITNEIK